MNTIKRIDPRRPFTITADRAQAHHARRDGLAARWQFAAHGSTASAHREHAKPRRTMAAPQRMLLVAAHATAARWMIMRARPWLPLR